jgi:hypothetical protein
MDNQSECHLQEWIFLGFLYVYHARTLHKLQPRKKEWICVVELFPVYSTPNEKEECSYFSIQARSYMPKGYIDIYLSLVNSTFCYH